MRFQQLELKWLGKSSVFLRKNEVWGLKELKSGKDSYYETYMESVCKSWVFMGGLDELVERKEAFGE
jgi:hypothetical protein